MTSSLEHLEEQLRAAQCTKRPVYLLGDINFNVLDTNASSVRRYQSVLCELNMSQLVKEPTHLYPPPAALDHVITNQLDPAAEVEVLPDAISDHQPVIVSARLGRVRAPSRWRTARRWGRADWNAICLSFLEADWSGVDGATDVDECVQQFMTVWDSVMDRFCPVKRVRVSKPHCPWLAHDPELTELMVERNSARDTWLCLRTEEARADYTRLRNAVKSRLISSRREFLCGELESGSRREFWRNLKLATARRPPPAEAGADSPEEMEAAADALNRHFATVGSRIADELRDSVAAARDSPRPSTVCAAAFHLQGVTLPELSRCLRSMSASRAVGLDGVPLFAVRKCFPVIAPYLLRLINLSLSTKVFPDCWKTASIVPILKSGDPTVPSNNRPISLLSVLSKILEKVVCTQLTSYLERVCILSPRQYAYRSHHSTEDALLCVVERLIANTDEGLVSSVTTLDLSKAFDSVDHELLLCKLSWYGVADLEWFRSYLTGRQQVVRGGRETLPVTCGVPQGSIIGPILFILFTTDLPAHVTHGILTSYADDTVHVDCASPDEPGLTDLKARMEQTMRELIAWFSSNSLKMNEKKTDFILVGSKKNLIKSDSFSFDINGAAFHRSEKLKILGVIVDETLAWEAHISGVVKKCNSILVSLFRFRHYFNSESLKIIIEAYVFPHISYCLCVWGGAAKGRLYKIQKIINFAARIVTGVKKHEHITPALKSLNWSRIESLVVRRDITKVYKTLIMDGAPLELRELFTPRAAVSVRETRAAEHGCLHLRRCRLTSSQRAFSYRAAVEWNRLTHPVRVTPTLRSFKAAISEISEIA